MSIVFRGSRQIVSVFLGVLIVAGVACSDKENPVAPDQGTRVEESGRWSSTLWKAHEGALAYLGSARGDLTISVDTHGVRSARATGAALQLGAAKIQALGKELVSSAPTLMMSPPSSPIPSATVGIVRPTLRVKSVKLRTPDGRNVSMQFLDDPRGQGRPPLAVLTFLNGRAIGFNQYTYAPDGDGWRTTRVRSTGYDLNENAAFVADQDFSDVRSHPAKVSSVGLGWWSTHANKAGKLLADLVTPDVAYAASSIECAAEMIEVGIATAEWSGAALVLAAAIASCEESPGTCQAAVNGARVLLAAATARLAAATTALYKCTHPPPPSPVGGCLETNRVSASPSVANGMRIAQNCLTDKSGTGVAYTGGGGGGGGGEWACYTLVWEISYDGGETWSVYASETFCYLMN